MQDRARHNRRQTRDIIEDKIRQQEKKTRKDTTRPEKTREREVKAR
jgi:hypothetical protein